jgi:hypothetical protein
MTRFTYINQHIETIKFEIKIGLISPTVLRHWEIYCRFDYYRKLGETVGMSVIYTGDDLKVDDRRIYKIKKLMESEL